MNPNIERREECPNSSTAPFHGTGINRNVRTEYRFRRLFLSNHIKFGSITLQSFHYANVRMKYFILSCILIRIVASFLFLSFPLVIVLFTFITFFLCPPFMREPSSPPLRDKIYVRSLIKKMNKKCKKKQKSKKTQKRK